MLIAPSKQVRWLIDCDSFFASCEISLRPELKWLPVCVWGDIVIAATYDLKALWISIWTPVWEVKKIAPLNTVFLKPRMEVYKEISWRLMSYLHKKAIDIQVFSIDEAFVEFTSYDRAYNMSYEKMMILLQRDIQQKIWIPVSIWLAPTKLLAKIGAGFAKPYGVFVCLEENDINVFLQSLPFWKIPFIGRQTQKKLRFTCETAFDFKKLAYEVVKQELWTSWLKIWFELNSYNAMTLWRQKTKPKSIGRSRSFNPYFTHDKQKVW